MERKTILFFTHAAQFGGAEKSLLELLGNLDRQRFEPRALLLAQGPLSEKLEEDGIDVHIIDTPEEILATRRHEFFTPGNITRSIRRAKLSRVVAQTVSDFADSVGADLIYTNSTKAHLIGGLAGRRSRIPVLWHIRDYLTSSGARRIHSIAARFMAKCIVCNSKYVAGQFRKHKNVKVVYSGIDPEQATPARKPSDVRAEFGIPEAAPLLGMAGRLEPWKGHRVFLRAAARILEDVRDTRFIIAGSTLYGEPAYADYLKKLAEDYAIADRVTFTGFREDAPDIINAMDIYVHPSEEPEPFGRGIVEAMLLGKPVIASGDGGPEEIVRHAETGILIDPGDSVGLARAAVQLIDNPEVAEVLGKNGRDRANALFTLEQTVNQIHNILDGILSGAK